MLSTAAGTLSLAAKATTPKAERSAGSHKHWDGSNGDSRFPGRIHHVLAAG